MNGKRSAGAAGSGLVPLLAIAAILAGGVFVALGLIRSNPIEDALAKRDVINILFVLEGPPESPPDGTAASDNAAGAAAGPAKKRPQGSFVLMFSPQNNRAAIISIPGELGMILKTVNRVDRIDAVYDPRNITPYITELESLLGLKIGYSVIIKWEDLGRIVDLIEGVEIFIPQTVEIYGNDPVLFPSGTALLDGDKARQYISFEIPSEERGEAHMRRERFFLGLLESLSEKNKLLKNPQVAPVFYSMLKTKMNRASREDLINALATLGRNRSSIQGVTGTYRDDSGQELLIPSYNGTLIKDIVRQTQGSLSREDSLALAERMWTVEILNGTVTTGLALRTAELIRGFRYEVVATGNAGRNDYAQTEIIDRTGNEDAVSLFAGIIKCKNIRSEPKLQDMETAAPPAAEQNPDYRADFTLILGRDFNGRVVTGN